MVDCTNLPGLQDHKNASNMSDLPNCSLQTLYNLRWNILIKEWIPADGRRRTWFSFLKCWSCYIFAYYSTACYSESIKTVPEGDKRHLNPHAGPWKNSSQLGFNYGVFKMIRPKKAKTRKQMKLKISLQNIFSVFPSGLTAAWKSFPNLRLLSLFVRINCLRATERVQPKTVLSRLTLISEQHTSF